jgi:2-succinyl-5-enolpyruvyl-6-hydroxy-3-cyclohexene-1-carboxylate synthase
VPRGVERRVPFAAVDPTNRNTALASAMVEELARCGVRNAVVAPGSRSTPLALALWRQPAIDVAVIVDERSAAFFALGAAYASGTPAAVLCTSGTAAVNLHPAVCEADESGVPLIVLTADRPPELRGIGAGQTIDQLKLYGSAVRWFCEVGTHDADDPGLLHYRSVACRAYAAARGDPRPGPVHLNVAWRDPLGPEARPEDVTATSDLALRGRGERPLTGVPNGTAPPPSHALIEVMVDHVAEWRRGLIVCGRQPDPALAVPVAELARASGYPIIAEPTSQLRLGPHDRDLVISAYDAIARARPDALAPEVVLRFGEMPTSKALRAWIGALHDCRQLVVDGGFGWNEPTNAALVLMRVDPSAFASRLASAIRAPGDRAFAEDWKAADGAASQAVADELADADEVSEPAVHAALGELYADGDVVYTASSMPIRDQEAFVPPGSASVRFLANRGANGIDGLISSGIGAAASTGQPTWIITGDLGLYHDMNGLTAIREASAPVRIVVLNNNGGGIFEFLPQADQVERDEFEAVLGTPLGIEPRKVAELHDIPHVEVRDVADLAAAAEVGTGVIEILVDRRKNVEVHRRIAERVATAVGSAQTA